MKKLFTLVFGMMLSLVANAATFDIGEPTSHPKSDDGSQVFYDPDTKVITFYKQWDYRPGWWLAWNNDTKANTGQDFSQFDQLVVEVDNPSKVNVQIVVQYANDETSSGTGSGDKIVVKLNKKEGYADKVMQAYFQCASEVSEPTTITFKKAYFETTDPTTSSVLFEGEKALDSWGANIMISKDNFADVSAGDVIRITAKPGAAVAGWDYGAQVLPKTQRAGWDAIAGTLNFDEEGSKDIVLSDDAIEVKNGSEANAEKVSTTMIAELKEFGLVLQGMGSVVTKVELLKSQTNGISSSVVTPTTKSTKTYNLAGQEVNASYKGVVIQNGKKFVQK